MLSLFDNEHKVVVAPVSIAMAIGMVLSLYFVFAIRSILILLFLAFIITVALNPLVSFFEKRLKLARGLSAAIVYALMVIVLVGLVAFILPPVVRDAYHLVKNIDLPVLQEQIGDLRFTISEVTALADRVGGSVGLVFSAITSTFTGVFTFLTLLVMSVYMMIDRPYLHRKMVWFSRNKRHIALAKDFLNQVELQLGGWVRGQIILMVLIGIVTYIGLALLGVPYALPLAVLAGLLEILPNLGPTIAAVPAIFIAYLNLGPVFAGLTVVFYVLVQQLENNLIVPKIMRDNVDVNPLVAMTLILIGVQLGGVIGALLAVPLYIVIRTLYAMWFRQQE